MQCPACHEPVAVWATFCPHCGARQGAPEPDPRAADPTSAPEAVESGKAPADPTPESSLTAELFGVPVDPTHSDGMPPVEDPYAVYAAAPVADAGAAAAAAGFGAPTGSAVGPEHGTHPLVSRPEPEWTQWDDEVEPPRKGAASWLLGVAAAIVVLTLGFVMWSFLSVGETGDASNSPTALTTTSARPAPGQSSPQASASAASPSPSAGSPSPSATPAGAVPAGAISCGGSGAGDAAAVFAADANTSCPFAVEVGNAYRAANSGGAPASITAKSPVTGKDYSLVCSGSVPTTCVADSGATVYLTRAG